MSERFLIKRADLTIVVSEANMRDGIKHCGMKRYKLVHNGINLEKFNPDKNYPDIKVKEVKPRKYLRVYFTNCLRCKRVSVTVKCTVQMPYKKVLC